MNLKPHTKDDVDINLTPLIDVVFLLLIFFMVSTTFKQESSITINLPEASSEKPVAQDNLIEISIDEQGRFFINQAQVVNTRLATVKRALEKIVAGRKNLIVVISADAKTPHQSVVTAMDAARQAGLLNLSIATRRPQGSPGQ